MLVYKYAEIFYLYVFEWEKLFCIRLCKSKLKIRKQREK